MSIFGIEIDDNFIPLANFFGFAILGALSILGLRWGAKNPTSAERQVEVAGAIVDSDSIRQLTAAIEAHNMELIASRVDHDKLRQVGYRLCEAIERASNELREIRSGMYELTKEVAVNGRR